MCGIVGIGGKHEPGWVLSMNDVITHRGPDDDGIYSSPDRLVSLAMRRLSILDLEGGHQPMGNEDGSAWIVFNGEIFNAPELRARLERQGHRFRTANSDTEVLLHLYDEKREDMLHDLNGMYAFVIHDQRRDVLFGARDRMGIKPLYYTHAAGRFAFASELKSLLPLPFVTREIDQQSLFHYMTLLYVPSEASIIQGIRRVPPAHSFVYDLHNNQLKLRQYWRLEFQGVEDHSEDEWVEIVRAEARAAVKRWTLSDVPIACSLSGGIDSSAIVGLLAEQGYPRIRTYSLGFVGETEQSWNETTLARQVAQRWGTEHQEIFLTPPELMDDLVAMVWHLDEPYGGGLPSWYVFREMSKGVKVGLTGTGGDELFGNYGRFRAYEADRLVRGSLALRRWAKKDGMEAVAGVLSPFAALTNRLPSSLAFVGRGRFLSKLPHTLRRPFGLLYYANRENVSDDRKRTDVLQVNDLALRDTTSYLQDLYDDSRAPDLRSGLAAVDARTQLAEEFLFMTDRFSMAHSLEARVPFLDHELVETVFSIPSSIRTKTGNAKYLFKRAVADLLPPDLLTAPKRGFVIPVQLWLRRELRPLAERLLHPQRLYRQGFFRREFYEHFVLPHLEGRAVFTWQVWAALMFQLWHLVFIEQNQEGAPAYGWKDLC